MARSKPKNTYLMGIRDALPFLLVAGPFGMLFGVVAAEAGLSAAQAMAFSTVVFAGASQFAALQLMVDNAPILIVVATAMAVNLRMAMYSAWLAPWLGAAPLWQRALAAYVNVDQSFACAAVRFEQYPAWSVAQRMAFFFGVVTPIAPAWVGMTALGLWLGTGVPDGLALDFAMPVCFLAMIGPMMRTAAHLAAAFTSVALALLLAGVPYNLGLLVAALVAMAVGARVELWQAGKAAA